MSKLPLRMIPPTPFQPTRIRDSAFGPIEEIAPDVERNHDGSLRFNRKPRTSAEAFEMIARFKEDEK